MLVTQSCPTLCDPMDCSLPGFSVLGILHARILEWFASPFSKGSSRPRDRTWVFSIAGIFFSIWATGEEKNHKWYTIQQLSIEIQLLVRNGVKCYGHESELDSLFPQEFYHGVNRQIWVINMKEFIWECLFQLKRMGHFRDESEVRHFRNKSTALLMLLKSKYIQSVWHGPLVFFNSNFDICIIFFSFQSFVHIISSLYINIILISMNL